MNLVETQKGRNKKKHEIRHLLKNTSRLETEIRQLEQRRAKIRTGGFDYFTRLKNVKSINTIINI